MKHIIFKAMHHTVPLAVLIAGFHSTAYAQSESAPLTPLMVTITEPAPQSLTVPSANMAKARLEQIPGAVSVVPAEVWKDTQARTLKDVLDYTPGVFAQPKWGEDTRLSIRGSGLSRNFHMRGIALYQDGVPVNNSDGGTDFQEIDPTAFAYTEVYKGANGLRYGANSLGGAINLVSPTGYDARPFEGRIDWGSDNTHRMQASTGGNNGVVDGFFTVSAMDRDGFRDHSGGESIRASGNIGWRINDWAETRFYATVADIQQDIPGSVTKDAALTSPETAAANNIRQHYQRNIESYRLSNKTVFQLDKGLELEAGAYAVDKHLIHPIFQYLDYHYYDFGGFGRLTDASTIGGHGNRLTLGVTLSGGWVDNSQYVNLSGGNRGNIVSRSTDKSLNAVVYGENTFDLRPDLSLVTGLQILRAKREREDTLDNATDTSGKNTYTMFNPKIGLLWQADPSWQVFTNLSQSGEAPTFSELNFSNAALADIKAQRATTLEIGTRGSHEDLTWDLAVYRAHLRNEFQFFDLGGGNYSVTNAQKTIHQGIEAGVGVAVLKGLFDNKGGADKIWINGAYTFSDFRFDDDAAWGDNELPGAPRHFVRLEALYKSPKGFYAGPNVEWVPLAYHVDNANAVQTESYAILGLRAGYDASENVSFYVDARNLTDEKHISSASIAATANAASALFEPGDGRSVYLGMKVRW